MFTINYCFCFCHCYFWNVVLAVHDDDDVAVVLVVLVMVWYYEVTATAHRIGNQSIASVQLHKHLSTPLPVSRNHFVCLCVCVFLKWIIFARQNYSLHTHINQSKLKHNAITRNNNNKKKHVWKLTFIVMLQLLWYMYSDSAIDL